MSTAGSSRTLRISVLGVSVHDYHVPTFCDVANPERNDVTVYTTQGSYDRIEPSLSSVARSACRWTRKRDDTSMGSFLDAVESENEGLDVLHVVTPTGPGALPARFATFSPACPIVSMLYNTTEYERPSWPSGLRPSLATRLEGFLPPRLFEFVFGGHKRAYHQRFVRRLSVALVEHPLMAETLRTRPWWSVGTHTFFPVVFRETPHASLDGPLRIVVPGRVHPEIRAYDQLLDAIETVPDGLRDSFSVDLLGRTIGEASRPIVERCRELSARGYDVRCHPDTDWIPSSQYRETLRESTLVVAPLRAEIDGRVHGSGSILNALQHGRPLVLPSSFAVPEQIGDGVAQYRDTAELSSLLETIISDREFREEFQASATATAEQFGLREQRDRFETFLHEAIEGSSAT